MTSSVTAAQIAKIRRMVDEPTTTTYSDLDIQGIIEEHPLPDERGTDPYYWENNGTGVPTKTVNTSWFPTYDLNAAARDIWEEKAALVARLYDADADGGDYKRSQAYQNAIGMVRYFSSRTSMKRIPVHKSPRETLESQPWIGNLPEEDYDALPE